MRERSKMIALTRLLVGLLQCLALLGCASGTAGGGGGGGGGGTPPPPAITIGGAVPYYGQSSPLNLSYAIAGQGSFQLLLAGSGFTQTSVVQWNGNALPTQFAGSQNVDASVPAALIATPGSAAITVSDPATGVVSNSYTFAIASPGALNAGVVALVSAAPDGSPANGDSLVSPSISSTGRYVAFQSNATNLAPGPASGYQEIYERDTCVGAPPGCTPSTTRVTVTYDGSPVNAHSRFSAVSADGRYIAFDSQATNILPGSSICGPLATCVFLRDTCIGASSVCTPTTTIISANTQGQISTGSEPAMGENDRYVAFQSAASDLVTGVSGGQSYVRDTCNGAPAGCTPSTILVSESSSGVAGNSNSNTQAISSTGEFVAFLSYATDMVPNETVTPGWFWRDTCMGASAGCSPSTIRVDVTTSGAQPNQMAFSASLPSITADGRLVAFGSGATNLVPAIPCASTNGCGNVYVRDTCTGAGPSCTPSTSLISVGNDGSIGNCFDGGSPGNLTNVSMSSDGRFVSLGSISTNLTP
ncbi:MAG: hypothetical protein ACLP1Y_17535, partial [Candidatus Acidiferrales bacterium]